MLPRCPDRSVACRARTLSPQTPAFAPVCGCGAVSANTLKSAQTGFLRGKRGFSGTVLPRPLSLNSDKAVCGTAGALVPISAKAVSKSGWQNSANPICALWRLYRVISVLRRSRRFGSIFCRFSAISGVFLRISSHISSVLRCSRISRLTAAISS